MSLKANSQMDAHEGPARPAGPAGREVDCCKTCTEGTYLEHRVSAMLRGTTACTRQSCLCAWRSQVCAWCSPVHSLALHTRECSTQEHGGQDTWASRCESAIWLHIYMLGNTSNHWGWQRWLNYKLNNPLTKNIKSDIPWTWRKIILSQKYVQL